MFRCVYLLVYLLKKFKNNVEILLGMQYWEGGYK